MKFGNDDFCGNLSFIYFEQQSQIHYMKTKMYIILEVPTFIAQGKINPKFFNINRNGDSDMLISTT